MNRSFQLVGMAIALLLGGCGTSTVSLRVVQPAQINAQTYGGTVSVSEIMAVDPSHTGHATMIGRHIMAGVRAGYGGVVPRHDRASEFDSWDCVDELVAEEDYSQEWGEAASR